MALLREQIAKLQAEVESSNSRYQQLLKSAAMQSTGGVEGQAQRGQRGQRSVDIQLVGI